MHYSRHRLTASVAYMTTLTEASTIAYWSVGQKLDRVSSVHFSSVTSHCTRLLICFTRCCTINRLPNFIMSFYLYSLLAILQQIKVTDSGF